MDTVSVKLPKLTCQRCGHKWHPRSDDLPNRCAKCRSPYWRKPKKVKKEK